MSFAVLVAHFSEITGIRYSFFMGSVDAVRGFFILSGFLVFYSFMKKPNLRHYIDRRARRILPPYLFIVTLCWTLGFLVSEFPVKEYFMSTQLWKYVVANYSFLNFIEPSLPGCFGGESVNSSLWTMKVEILLYTTVPIVYYLMKKFRPFPVFVIIFNVLWHHHPGVNHRHFDVRWHRCSGGGKPRPYGYPFPFRCSLAVMASRRGDPCGRPTQTTTVARYK